MNIKYDLNKDIQNLLDKVLPNSILFRPLRKHIDWIATEIASMSKKYVEYKIKENENKKVNIL